MLKFTYLRLLDVELLLLGLRRHNSLAGVVAILVFHNLLVFGAQYVK